VASWLTSILPNLLSDGRLDLLAEPPMIKAEHGVMRLVGRTAQSV
jgi:hypothetical protein